MPPYGLKVVLAGLSSRKRWHAFVAIVIFLTSSAAHADFGDGDVPKDARWARLQDRSAIPLAQIGKNVVRITAVRGLDGIGAFRVVLRRDDRGNFTGQIEFFKRLADELVPNKRRPVVIIDHRKYESAGRLWLGLADRYWSMLEQRLRAVFAEAVPVNAMGKGPDGIDLYPSNQDGTAMLTEWRANGRTRWIDSATGSERLHRAVRLFLLRAVWTQSSLMVDRWPDCEPMISALDKVADPQENDGAEAPK